MPAGRKRKLQDPEQKEALTSFIGAKRVSVRDATDLWNAGPGESISCSAMHSRKQEVSAPLQACFDWFSMPDVDPEAEAWPIYVANLERTLNCLSLRSSEWGTGLEKAVNAAGGIRLLIYNDEAQAGNILNPDPVKKVLLVYIAIASMQDALAAEEAWIAVACVQKTVLENLRGGTSALMALIMKALHSKANLELDLPTGRRLVSLFTPSCYLGDHDGQRASFSIKGSAGSLCCIMCYNVLFRWNKEVPADCCTIEEHRAERFYLRRDEDFFALADSISEEGRPTWKQRLQQTSGITWVPDGLLFDVEARVLLPPSTCSTDILHDYFTNGVCNWEIGATMKHLQSKGCTLELLLDYAVAAGWRRAGDGEKTRPATLRRFFRPKFFAENEYKGDANECWSFVFLMRFLLSFFLENDEDPECVQVVDCFAALHLLCRELRRLRYMTCPLEGNMLTTLAELTRRHQELYVLTWPDLVRPKCHHRMHAPASAAMLRWLPNVLTHEKKHRCVKSGGLLDRMRAFLHASTKLQKSVLPRLLETSFFTGYNKLCPWSLGEPNRRANQALKEKFNDPGLRSCNQCHLLHRPVGRGDILLFAEEAWQMLCAVQGPQTPLTLEVRVLWHVASTVYGTIWHRSNSTKWATLSRNTCFTVAAWWKEESDNIVCLH